LPQAPLPEEKKPKVEEAPPSLDAAGVAEPETAIAESPALVENESLTPEHPEPAEATPDDASDPAAEPLAEPDASEPNSAL
jgi:hypothetical protein